MRRPSVWISMKAALRRLRHSRMNGSLLYGPVRSTVRTSVIFTSGTSLLGLQQGLDRPQHQLGDDAVALGGQVAGVGVEPGASLDGELGEVSVRVDQVNLLGAG